MSNQPLPPKLAFPCPKRWDEMHATGSQQRFCDQCQLHVHDLSALTARQGKRLLARSGEQTCVSFVTGPDGFDAHSLALAGIGAWMARGTAGNAGFPDDVNPVRLCFVQS